MSLEHFETLEPVSYEEMSSTERNVISNAARHAYEAVRKLRMIEGNKERTPWDSAELHVQQAAVHLAMSVFNNPEIEPPVTASAYQRVEQTVFYSVVKALLTGYARGAGAKLNVVSH